MKSEDADAQSLYKLWELFHLFDLHEASYSRMKSMISKERAAICLKCCYSHNV